MAFSFLTIYSGGKMGIEELREYYRHTPECTEKDFEPFNERGLRRCKHCSGIFNAKGDGVATTDRRFDENYDEWLAAEHPEVES